MLYTDSVQWSLLYRLDVYLSLMSVGVSPRYVSFVDVCGPSKEISATLEYVVAALRIVATLR